MLCVIASCQDLSFSFSSNIHSPCKIDEGNLVNTLHDPELLKKVTTAWIETHNIQKWKSSTSKVVDNDKTYPEIKEYKIPFHTEKPYTTVLISNYDAVVNLPKVLSIIMKTKITTKTEKRSFIFKNREYKIARVYNVPLIGKMTVFSVAIYHSSGKIRSQTVVKCEKLPWFAKWAIPHIKAEVEKSVKKYEVTQSRMACDADR